MAIKNYIDPITGEPCTESEYNIRCGGGGTTPTTTQTTTPTTPTGGNINPYTGQPFTTADLSGMGVATTKDFWNFYNQGLIQDGQYVGEAGVVGTGGWGDNPPVPYNIPGTTPTTPTTTPTVEMPTFGAGAGAGIPTPEVTPAPPYVKTPEQIAWEEKFVGKLDPWLEAEGYGIPEETQAQMIQQQTDVIKAREQESLRVMRNNMERRGITNSGFIFANEQTIHSNTTKEIASGIADVQIKSALMKMASFEKAMGFAAQFLGYLSEQSQLAYLPKMATWQAEQMAKLQAWQGKMDVYKMELNQAYQTQNLQLQAQLQMQLQNDQQSHEIEMAEMEIEYAQGAAKAEAQGSISGTIITGLFTVAAAVLG